jgi:hypothetical protein
MSNGDSSLLPPSFVDCAIGATPEDDADDLISSRRRPDTTNETCPSALFHD